MDSILVFHPVREDSLDLNMPDELMCLHGWPLMTNHADTSIHHQTHQGRHLHGWPQISGMPDDSLSLKGQTSTLSTLSPGSWPRGFKCMTSLQINHADVWVSSAAVLPAFSARNLNDAWGPQDWVFRLLGRLNDTVSAELMCLVLSRLSSMSLHMTGVGADHPYSVALYMQCLGEYSDLTGVCSKHMTYDCPSPLHFQTHWTSSHDWYLWSILSVPRHGRKTWLLVMNTFPIWWWTPCRRDWHGV